MIVDRIEDYMGGPGKPIPEELIATAAKLLERTLQRNLGKQKERGSRSPSPSSNWLCGRRMMFDFADPAIAPREPLSMRARMTFTFGDIVELAGILLAKQAGVPLRYPREDGTQLQCIGEFGGHPMVGHIDAGLDVGQGDGRTIVPVDWKSTSEYGFKLAKQAATDPDHEWWQDNTEVLQVRLYMDLIRQMGMGDGKLGILVKECKSTGHMAEIHVHHDQAELDLLVKRARYMGDLIHEYQHRLGMMGDDAAVPETRVGVLEHHLPPYPSFHKVVERGNVELPNGGGRGKALELAHWRCGYCPFTKQCNPGFDVVPLAKPVWRKPL